MFVAGSPLSIGIVRFLSTNPPQEAIRVRHPRLDGARPCSHHSSVPALLDLDVLVVDCQATGASPFYGVVLEIGWGVVRAGSAEGFEPQAHWIALPEGHVVPRQVQKLTGYEPDANVAALDAEVAWRSLRGAVPELSSVPTAIHFARFELPFLREWSERFEPGIAFPLDAVCVHAIANRLFPELPRQSLRALAGFLGHSLHLSRRSLGHVEATAFVWRRVCLELSNRGVRSWDDLKGWLAERAPPKPRSKKPTYPLDAQRYRSLPDEPGVYRFVRSNGDVLYVGKAASLKKRAASHFRGRAGTAQAPEMLTQVADIQVTLTASALEAALLESDLIKGLVPPYNVQLTGSDHVFYSSEAFTSAVTEPDTEHLLGPLPSAYALRPLAALASLLSEEPHSVFVRTHAVGVSAMWLPDEGVFAEGWRALRERRSPADVPTGVSARRGALALARRFLLAPAFADERDEAAEEQAEAVPREWDPLRVARHIERACADAFRSYRRARWLALLADSEVVYREPSATTARLLVIADGHIVTARDEAVSYRPGQRSRVRAGRPHFDRKSYDRLRILSTELKRIARDGGEVRVHWGPTRELPRALLAGVFALV